MSDSTPPVPGEGPSPQVPPVPAAPGAPWPGYGQPPGGYQPPAQNSGKAVAILVLGIASLATGCCIGAIPAIVALSMAGGATREIAASGGRLSGDGFIKGGVICSWISIGLTLVFIVFIIGLIALGAFSDANFDDTGRGIQSSMAWLRP